MSAYYECEEHKFFVAGEPAEDGSDFYIDEQIAEHERVHAEEARAREAEPAIALDGDSVVFGEFPRAEPAPATGREVHRKIVVADLEQLADLAEQTIELEGCTPTCLHWAVLRPAADVAEALAELLVAAEALDIEGRDLATLSEHALSVLARAIAEIESERGAARA